MSQSDSRGALDALGWNDRVAALYSELASPSDTPGRVVHVTRGHTVVVGIDGSEVLITSQTTSAVGDWVVLNDRAIVHTLLRWSTLDRQDPDGTGLQTLASNIDVVLIAAPADRLSPTRVERELAVAFDSGAHPIVVVTKSDLADPSTVPELEGRLKGVEIMACSATTLQGVDRVIRALRPDKTAVLLGPSGAGKSSLVNAVIGTDALAVGRVRDVDNRGRHTTSSRQLVAVPGGGVLIDTPGIRSLGLAGDGGLESTFPEIEELALACRFSDCRHEVEPDCAVLAAITERRLDPRRLDSFRKLHGEVDAAERNKDPLQRKEELRVWKLRAKAGRQKARRRSP